MQKRSFCRAHLARRARLRLERRAGARGGGTKHGGAVWATFRAACPGMTRVVCRLTRGEESHAYESRTFRVVVSTAVGACPDHLLPLIVDPIGPAVTAALISEEPKNRPQMTAARSLLATRNVAAVGIVSSSPMPTTRSDRQPQIFRLPHPGRLARQGFPGADGAGRQHLDHRPRWTLSGRQPATRPSSGEVRATRRPAARETVVRLPARHDSTSSSSRCSRGMVEQSRNPPAAGRRSIFAARRSQPTEGWESVCSHQTGCRSTVRAKTTSKSRSSGIRACTAPSGKKAHMQSPLFWARGRRSFVSGRHRYAGDRCRRGGDCKGDRAAGRSSSAAVCANSLAQSRIHFGE
jgi:hypothetical protein